MNRVVVVGTIVLTLVSAAYAAPIKAKYCAAVGVSDLAQDKQLADTLAKFASTHALKRLSNQGPNTNAWRNDDSTVQLAVTSNVEGLGSVVTLFDTNQPTGPTRGQLASYVTNNIGPTLKVTPCKDISGFKTPEIK